MNLVCFQGFLFQKSVFLLHLKSIVPPLRAFLESPFHLTYIRDVLADNGGGKRFWNVGQSLPNYTVPHPRKRPSSLVIFSMRDVWFM
jgi:hypothetical protein